MNELIYSFFICSILVVSLIYIWYKLLNKKINFKNHKVYVAFVCITIASTLNYLMVDKFIKITILTISFMIFFKYLFNEKTYKCIVTPIFYQLVIMVSEAIYAVIILMIFGEKSNLLLQSSIGTFFTNVAVAIISIIIIQFKAIIKIYNKLIKFTNKINRFQLLSLSIIMVLVLNILLMLTYYKVEFIYLLVFNICMILICFLVMFYYFKTQNNYNKVSDKYNVAIKSLKDYEDMMTKYRISNHENKNMLLTIRAMVLNREKNISDYIDSIVETKYNDDDKLLFKMGVIPTGGLRASIYSEILKIKSEGINYDINIDKNVSSVDLIELDTDSIVSVCKILGVFIDNSIESVKSLTHKMINISLYLENDSLLIKVSNNYKGYLDPLKISNEGYTTKGKGHGYGLALVKSIIQNNNVFENQTNISKNLFSQVLIIKLKKPQ